MSGRKKMFTRWANLTEKDKLLNECRLVSGLFITLNLTIKSVSDNAFIEREDNLIKEKALIQLFKNLTNNVHDCLKKWRDVNTIEKIRGTLDEQKKKEVLKVLDSMLHNGKLSQIREALNKFKINRRIV